MSVTTKQGQLLSLIEDNPGISQADLARRLGWGRNVTYSVIQGLKRKDMVVNKGSVRDSKYFATGREAKSEKRTSSPFPVEAWRAFCLGGRGNVA